MSITLFAYGKSPTRWKLPTLLTITWSLAIGATFFALRAKPPHLEVPLILAVVFIVGTLFSLSKFLEIWKEYEGVDLTEFKWSEMVHIFAPALYFAVWSIALVLAITTMVLA